MNKCFKVFCSFVTVVLFCSGLAFGEDKAPKVESWPGESHEYHCGDRIGAGGFYYSECKDIAVCWNARWGMFNSDEDSVLNDAYYRQNFKGEAELRKLDCDSLNLKELYYSIIKTDFIPNSDLCTIATNDDGNWHTSEISELYSVLRYVVEAHQRGLNCGS